MSFGFMTVIALREVRLMSETASEHRAVGFECLCGAGFETALGYSRHRARCEEHVEGGEADA